MDQFEFGDDRLPSRFWDKVQSTGGCWEWLGAKTGRSSAKYGQLRWQGKIRSAHRVVYSALVGPIPAGLHIDHLCRNTICVNPAHLEVVTPRENILRGISGAAINARKAYCDRGHALVPENLKPNSRGSRQCRECWNASNREYLKRRHQRRKAQRADYEGIFASVPVGRANAVTAAQVADRADVARGPCGWQLTAMLRGAYAGRGLHASYDEKLRRNVWWRNG